MTCLETTALAHRYANGETAVGGIDLRVPYGSIYGFLGPNGAGKTTTLRLLLGLLRRQCGTISVFGRDIDADRTEILRDVGSLIESPSLYAHLSARENLRLLRVIHRVPAARVEEVLALVGLSDAANKKAGQFSLGMKQRLGIAAALLHSPALLILDEPTNGLDPNGIVDMRELLLQLHRESGVTILVSSHLLAEMEKIATHLGIIHRGRMMFQGTLAELRGRRRHAVAVRLRTSDDARALDVIAAESVDAAIAYGEIIMPAMPGQRIAHLNRRLVERGIDVYSLAAIEEDLETIFTNLIARHAR